MPTLSDNSREIIYTPKEEVFNEICFALFDHLWENRGEVIRRLGVATMTGGMAFLFGCAVYWTFFPKAKKGRRP